MNKTDFDKSKDLKGGKTPDPKGGKDFKDKKPNNCHKGRGKYGDNKESRKDGKMKFVNDPAYYKLNPNLTENAARISFGNPAGLKLDFGVTKTAAGTAVPNPTTTIPTFLSLEMVPTIGTNGAATDPICVAAKSAYSWVRHANSGHTNYDSPDFIIYLLAMREIYGYLGWITRLSALINKYSAVNREIPTAAFELNHVNFQDVMANQAALRFYINTFAKKANSLSVPKSLPMYAKAFNMYANVFKEGKSGKDQHYLYVPAGFLVYNPTKYTTGGCLEYKRLKDFSSNPMLSFNDIMTIGNALLNPLLSDEDIGIMSGDVRKAFSDSGLYLLGSIPTDLVIEFVQDAFELQIMHNASIGQMNAIYQAWSTSSRTLLGDVMQDANGVLVQCFQAETSGAGALYLNNQLIDIDSDVPTEDEIIEASLYKVFPIEKSASSSYSITTGIDSNQAITTDYVLDTFGDYVCVMVLKKVPGTLSAIRNADNFEVKFDWCPIRVSFQTGTFDAFGQFHNYTTVNKDVISRIHLSNLLSLFAIPSVEHLK